MKFKMKSNPFFFFENPYRIISQIGLNVYRIRLFITTFRVFKTRRANTRFQISSRMRAILEKKTEFIER